MLHHVTALALANRRPPWSSNLAQPSPQSQMAGRFPTCRKVMMIPPFGRHQQASSSPIHPDEFSAGRPHERIPPTAQDNDLRAGPVAVRFLVGSRFDGHNMPDHRVAGEMNSKPAETDAAIGMVIQLDGIKIGDKINRSILKLARL